MLAKDVQILIINPTLTTRKIIKKAFTELGYKNIFEAEDIKSAWKILCDQSTMGSPLNLVVSAPTFSTNSSDKSGLDLLADCRAHQDFNKIFFFLSVQESEHNLAIEALKRGATDYLSLPLNPGTLSGKLHALTGLARREVA